MWAVVEVCFGEAVGSFFFWFGKVWFKFVRIISFFGVVTESKNLVYIRF